MINISVGNQVIMTINDDQINVMAYSFSKAGLQQLVISNLVNILNQKLAEGKLNLQNDWLPIIRSRFNTMPTQDLALANLIFSQPDYKDYDSRNS